MKTLDEIIAQIGRDSYTTMESLEDLEALRDSWRAWRLSVAKLSVEQVELTDRLDIEINRLRQEVQDLTEELEDGTRGASSTEEFSA